jgi:hypothetical protein
VGADGEADVGGADQGHGEGMVGRIGSGTGVPPV